MEIIVIALMITNVLAMNKINKLRQEIEILKPPF
jgi:hypothetical protein